MYSIHSIKELTSDKNKKLVFIHTPKCGGSYVSSILSHLNIENKGHEQAILNDNYIYFTVIRNPVERFESLLNYRLNEKTPRNDWPKHLSYVYDDINIKLDDIISQMTDEEILGFSPYKTINYWIKNVDIIITLDNLPKILEYFGYTYDVNLFNPVNVSNKIRGKINQQNKDRLQNIFNDDVNIYNMVINSAF
jgi:hypothetical protein